MRVQRHLVSLAAAAGLMAATTAPQAQELYDPAVLRSNPDGVRLSCHNDPDGPGLSYAGPSPADYPEYEVDNDGGLAQPLDPLITVANALSYEPLATWPNIDLVFAIDPSIWSVALENILTDEDSYVHKGCDFRHLPRSARPAHAPAAARRQRDLHPDQLGRGPQLRRRIPARAQPRAGRAGAAPALHGALSPAARRFQLGLLRAALPRPARPDRCRGPGRSEEAVLVPALSRQLLRQQREHAVSGPRRRSGRRTARVLPVAYAGARRPRRDGGRRPRDRA